MRGGGGPFYYFPKKVAFFLLSSFWGEKEKAAEAETQTLFSSFPESRGLFLGGCGKGKSLLIPKIGLKGEGSRGGRNYPHSDFCCKK